MQKASQKKIEDSLLGVHGHPSGVRALLDYVRSFCFDYDIRLKFSRTLSVDSGDGVPCNGYFDPEDKVLAVAIRKDISDWFPIFLHEFCHAKQFVDDPKWFFAGCDAEARIFEWAYSRVVVPPKRPIRKYVKLCIDLEKDCEIRTLALVNKFDIASVVPVEEYAKKANAYLFFWRYFYDVRKWYKKGKAPYALEDVWTAMPVDVAIDHMRMPPDIRKVFEAHMVVG